MPEASLAWHVRAWGRWMLAQARRELAGHYPAYAEFQPLTANGDDALRLLEMDGDGVAQLDPLNAEFGDAYLQDPRNLRWVAPKGPRWPTLDPRGVLQAVPRRTAPAQDPLAVPEGQQARPADHGAEPDGPGGRLRRAARRPPERRQRGAAAGARTSASGPAPCPAGRPKCPVCGAIMAMSDLRYEGHSGRLGAVMTAVVVDGPKGKEYRRPTEREIEAPQ